MKILTSISYYVPYVSGLTIYSQRLAEALVKRGYQVSVLTSRHEIKLPLKSEINGVRVIRSPVLFKIGKGNIMPLWLKDGWRLIREHDLVIFHLPQVEALLLAIIAKILKKKTVVIYHCDLVLPRSVMNFFLEKLVGLANYFTSLMANKIVSYTKDYGLSSLFLKKFKNKLIFILPPVLVEKTDENGRKYIREKIKAKEGEILIGFAGRVAAEKGIEYLFEIIPLLIKEKAAPKIIIAGPENEVVGESAYVSRVKKLSKKYKKKIVYLGSLDQRLMAAFYEQIDLLVLPSLNRTESFGLVQVEAMLFGKPVIATNLPGVRVPIRLSKMGELVKKRDSRAIKKAILNITQNRPNYIQPVATLNKIFNFKKTINQYERLFQDLC